MPDMLTILNAGQAIKKTNYFDSAHARAGMCYLSWNAGAGRVLLPDSLLPDIQEMRSAKYVVVSRGPWTDQGGREAIELLFEDGSDDPFCLHLVIEQTDRRIPETDQGGGFVITICTRAGEQLRFAGKYRVVEEIPCLLPWSEH